MTQMGARLRTGLLAAAAETGHRIGISGPLAMPTLLFEDDPDLARGRCFSHEAAKQGVIFHPVLNWFMSGAHTGAGHRPGHRDGKDGVSQDADPGLSGVKAHCGPLACPPAGACVS
jgi:hypothetical protein